MSRVLWTIFTPDEYVAVSNWVVFEASTFQILRHTSCLDMCHCYASLHISIHLSAFISIHIPHMSVHMTTFAGSATLCLLFSSHSLRGKTCRAWPLLPDAIAQGCGALQTSRCSLVTMQVSFNGLPI